MAATLKGKDLRPKGKEELIRLVDVFNDDINSLRAAQLAVGPINTMGLIASQIRILRKNIARAKTIIGEFEREEVRAEEAKHPDRIPLSLITKKTRSKRRALYKKLKLRVERYIMRTKRKEEFEAQKLKAFESQKALESTQQAVLAVQSQGIIES